jgi:hypothetical protein
MPAEGSASLSKGDGAGFEDADKFNVAMAELVRPGEARSAGTDVAQAGGCAGASLLPS